MILMITGRPIVKKNRMRIVSHGGRSFPIPSKAYKTFEADAVPQILQQTKGKKFQGRLILSLKFYIKGKHHVDLDNLISSLCDVLQEAGTVPDDDQIDSITAIKMSSSEWKTEINLQEYHE